MPTKKSIIFDLTHSPKQSYSPSEVRSLVNSVNMIKEPARPPLRLKKGDVYVSYVGAKKRPVVICKVIGDIVIGVPLSTTENELNLMKSKSRFFGDGYFSKQFVTSTYEFAMENFTGVYDNEKLLRKAIKELKKFYETI